MVLLLKYIYLNDTHIYLLYAIMLYFVRKQKSVTNHTMATLLIE